MGADTPPPFDGCASTTNTISRMYENSRDSVVDLFGRESILSEWDALQRQAREIHFRKMQIKQSLMDDLGRADVGVCSDWTVQWKEQKRGVVSVEKLRKTYPGINIGKVMTCKTFRKFSIRKETSYGTD